jgi:hypothetical protein
MASWLKGIARTAAGTDADADADAVIPTPHPIFHLPQSCIPAHLHAEIFDKDLLRPAEWPFTTKKRSRIAYQRLVLVCCQHSQQRSAMRCVTMSPFPPSIAFWRSFRTSPRSTRRLHCILANKAFQEPVILIFMILRLSLLILSDRMGSTFSDPEPRSRLIGAAVPTVIGRCFGGEMFRGRRLW